MLPGSLHGEGPRPEPMQAWETLLLLLLSNCTSLTSLTLPDTLTFVGDYAFIGCSPGRFAGSQLCECRVNARAERIFRQTQTPTGPADLEMPASRLAVANGLCGQADNPSFEAASPDPISGCRWQALCYHNVCLPSSGVRTCFLGTACPVACVVLLLTTDRHNQQPESHSPAHRQHRQKQLSTTPPPQHSPATRTREDADWIKLWIRPVERHRSMATSQSGTCPA